MRYIALILALIVSSAFAGKSPRIPKTTKVQDYIDFKDDLDFANMKLAIQRNLSYFNSADLTVSFQFGQDIYTRKDLKETLEAFLILVEQAQICLKKKPHTDCYGDFSKSINAEFNVYRPNPLSWEQGYKTNQSLFTAYYSPDFTGSRTKTDVFKYPVYKLPQSSKLRSLSRDAIDFEKKLAGKNLELMYVKEGLYDIWLLHVEGGGRVKIHNPDGSVENTYLSYAGSNKQSFNMLYRYMLDHGMLMPGKAGIEYQRSYMQDHPEDQREILASCPSYIFFKETNHEPLGVKSIILTENRSLASDYRIYKEYGILNFIQAKKFTRTQQQTALRPFSRFFINQDTGGAIKGNARSDLYFGFGRKAELAANNLKILGNQFFLLKKKN